MLFRSPVDGGFVQLGTHEGTFVGVRRVFDWGVGDYRLTVERAEPDGDGDWFSMSVRQVAPIGVVGVRPRTLGPIVALGSLRFRRADPEVPATIGPSGPAFLEVYGNARTYGEIADWSLDLMAYGDGRRVLRARTEYPAFPHTEVPNADAFLDAARDRVVMRFGRSVERRHPPSPLF